MKEKNKPLSYRKMRNIQLLIVFLSVIIMNACTVSSDKNRNTPQVASSSSSWQTSLQEKLPLLGHRNWIVVTDMAYPLQTKPGITTYYADESYSEVLSTVLKVLSETPHVQPIVYQDKELAFVKEELCAGIDDFRQQTAKVFASTKVIPMKHESLIAKLDSISNVFEVVIIKTNLTKPYTSTFIELDCKYWNGEKQALLNKGMELNNQ